MLKLRRKPRNPAERMRFAIEAMPRPTRIAMLHGLESNRIMAGTYAEKGGPGVCPMLAAHRNGGRTSLSSFARSWDRFTGATRPRAATKRELRALRSSLEMSLINEATGGEPLASAANRIRAERAALRARDAAARGPAARPEPRQRADTGERDRSGELRRRSRWAWILPARRYDVYRERLAAASEQLSEQRAEELLSHTPSSEGSLGRV